MHVSETDAADLVGPVKFLLSCYASSLMELLSLVPGLIGREPIEVDDVGFIADGLVKRLRACECRAEQLVLVCGESPGSLAVEDGDVFGLEKTAASAIAQLDFSRFYLGEAAASREGGAWGSCSFCEWGGTVFSLGGFAWSLCGSGRSLQRAEGDAGTGAVEPRFVRWDASAVFDAGLPDQRHCRGLWGWLPA